MKALKAITWLCLVAPALYAQQPAPPAAVPMPSGPLLKRAPEFAEWLVTYTDLSAAKESAGSSSDPGSKDNAATSGTPQAKQPARRALFTKTRDTIHFLLMEGGGQKYEVWRKGDLQVAQEPGWNEPALAKGNTPDDPIYLDFSRCDFKGFEWVSAKTYLTVTKVQGIDSIVFKKDSNYAYVGLESRLPLMLIANGETAVYQFRPPPQAMLTLPPNFQAPIDAQAKRVQQLTARAARPF